MDIDISSWIDDMYSAGSLLLLYLAIFFIANSIYSKKSGYNVKSQILDNNNKAVALAFSGYLLAISIIFIGCVIGPSKGILQDLIVVVKYSPLGLLLLYIAHLVNDKLILYQFCNKKELVDDKSIATGAVQASSYIASGLIIAGSIQGEGGDWITTLVFFSCGQVFLVIMTFIYNRMTTFDLHKEIEHDNAAAGIGFAGTLIALGIILSQAVAGNFISWEYNIGNFVGMAVIACFFMPIFRTIIDKLVLPKADLSEKIATSRNMGAAVLECSVTTGFAAVLSFLL